MNTTAILVEIASNPGTVNLGSMILSPLRVIGWIVLVVFLIWAALTIDDLFVFSFSCSNHRRSPYELRSIAREEPYAGTARSICQDTEMV